jgi:hypothetical protein
MNQTMNFQSHGLACLYLTGLFIFLFFTTGCVTSPPAELDSGSSGTEAGVSSTQEGTATVNAMNNAGQQDSAAGNTEPRAFRIVRVHNELKFAILQNVTGAFPPPGTELVVYRNSEAVGKLTAGSQAEETFFSADIVEGPIRDSDVAFLMPAKKENLTIETTEEEIPEFLRVP